MCLNNSWMRSHCIFGIGLVWEKPNKISLIKIDIIDLIKIERVLPKLGSDSGLWFRLSCQLSCYIGVAGFRVELARWWGGEGRVSLRSCLWSRFVFSRFSLRPWNNKLSALHRIYLHNCSVSSLPWGISLSQAKQWIRRIKHLHPLLNELFRIWFTKLCVEDACQCYSTIR